LFKALAEEEKVNNVTMSPKPVASFYVYHYLHEKNKTLVEPLTEELLRMEEKGIVEKIRRQVKGTIQKR